MIWKTSVHYARFGLLLALVSSQLTEEEKKVIVDLHNQYRYYVIPEAADMLYMTWNNTLASVAEGYAARCILGHNSEVTNQLGENLYITTETLSVNKATDRWFEEKKHYDYDSNKCKLDMCGHYTQVVWAKTNSVGCASHFCRRIEAIDQTDATILVCNYYPRGNVAGHRPYEAGRSCSKCPEDAIDCVQDACVQDISLMEKSDSATRRSVTHQKTAVGSTGFTKPSLATILLAGLLVVLVH